MSLHQYCLPKNLKRNLQSAEEREKRMMQRIFDRVPRKKRTIYSYRRNTSNGARRSASLTKKTVQEDKDVILNRILSNVPRKKRTIDYEYVLAPRNPQARPKDPQARPKDPQARPKDPKARPKDPQARPKDPQARPKDPKARPKDPQTRPKDPQARPKDPQARPKDPQARPKDPQARPKDPRARPKDPQASPESPEAPDPPLRTTQIKTPEWLIQVMRSMNGADDPKLILEKTLDVNDVDSHQNRLSIPINSVIQNDFLTLEETRIIDDDDITTNEGKMGVGAFLVDQRTIKWNVGFKQWVLTTKSGRIYWSFVLRGEWRNVVKANGLKAGDKISLWSFRCREFLFFALVPSTSSTVLVKEVSGTIRAPLQ